MKNDKKNIFISHIHEDDSKLGDLKNLLNNNGMTIRDYSINSDKPNRAKNEEYIKDKILKPQIERCSVLVVYVSKDSKNSKYVDWEIECAHRLGKRVVGVWERGELGCDLPQALESYGDALSGWDSNNIIKSINGDNIQENPDGSSRPERNITRHPC